LTIDKKIKAKHDQKLQPKQNTNLQIEEQLKSTSLSNSLPEYPIFNGDLKKQINILGNRLIPVVQRQAIAEHIGNMQGNLHLQNVLSDVAQNPVNTSNISNKEKKKSDSKASVNYQATDKHSDSTSSVAIGANATGINSKYIQRYDSFEHAQLGDSAAGSKTLDIQGIQITMGEINALADFYGDPQDIRNADPNELRQLVTLLRRQKEDPESVSEADWEAATGGRYTELAENNSAHFSPQNAELIPPQPSTPTSGEDHQSVWISHHRQALALARHAAVRENEQVKQAVMTEARVVNSFADHFLSDAFSAGHLFNKDDVMAVVGRNLSQLTDGQLGRLFSTVANTVFNEQGSIIAQYELDIPGPWWPNLNPFWFKKLLEGIYEERPTVVYNAIVKSAHDKLNTWPGGVPVENDYGRWNLSGDDTLASSPQTQMWAQKAIEESRANLEIAMEPRSITAEEFNGLVDRVLTYFPRPTEESTEMIHAMLDHVTDPNSQMVAAISEVLSSQIGVVLEKIMAEGHIRPVTTAEERIRENEARQQAETLRKVFIEQDPAYVNWFIRNLSGV